MERKVWSNGEIWAEEDRNEQTIKKKAFGKCSIDEEKKRLIKRIKKIIDAEGKWKQNEKVQWE